MTDEQFIEFSKLNPRAAADYLSNLAYPGYEVQINWNLPEDVVETLTGPTVHKKGLLTMHPFTLARFTVNADANYALDLLRKFLHEYIDRKFRNARVIDTYLETGQFICQA